MADAKALFKRHAMNFDFILKNTKMQCENGTERNPDQEDANALAIIYGACIIAEAIKNTLDDEEAMPAINRVG